MKNDFDLSRRCFLGGLVSLGASAALGGVGAAAPRLRFGVITDVHFAFDGKTLLKQWNDATLKKTLAWYRDQGVDAIVCGGDIADRSLIDEMQAFADAWFSVFPNDRRPDGGKVERVFVTGNHDNHGHKIYKGLPKIWPDEKERESHIFANDREKWWKEIFHEDYQTIYLKNVKGYTFIGSMWDSVNGPSTDAMVNYGRIEPFMAAHAKEIDPTKPFFYVQHPHPKDTCYGAWAWEHDYGHVTKCLSKFPNAVAFSGHTHYPLTDERSIWQGPSGFTSIGAASLRYTGFGGEFPKKEGGLFGSYVWFSSQGLLVSVYDDKIVYERREFLDGVEIGDAWVQPIAYGKEPSFSFEKRAPLFKAPAFAADARLAFVPDKKTGAFELRIPAVQSDKNARGYVYEIDAVGADGTRLFRRIMETGCNRPLAAKIATAMSTVPYKRAELPPAPFSFTVTPFSCFRKAGAPLKLTVDKLPS